MTAAERVARAAVRLKRVRPQYGARWAEAWTALWAAVLQRQKMTKPRRRGRKAT